MCINSLIRLPLPMKDIIQSLTHQTCHFYLNCWHQSALVSIDDTSDLISSMQKNNALGFHLYLTFQTSQDCLGFQFAACPRTLAAAEQPSPSGFSMQSLVSVRVLTLVVAEATTTTLKASESAKTSALHPDLPSLEFKVGVDRYRLSDLDLDK